MIHELLPPDFLDAITQSTYWPKRSATNSLSRSDLNPWGDPKLDSLIILRFACLREYQARNPESQQLFWRHMSREAECIAEAERDMFESMYLVLVDMEREYIESKYLDAELESLDLDKLAKKVKSGPVEIEEPTHNWRLRGRFGVTRFMLPPDFLGHQEYNAQLIGESLDKQKPIVVTPIRDITKRFLRKWGDSASYLYSELMQSTRIMHQDIMRKAQEHNVLVGPSAKNRSLLVNQYIPKPDILTFLGWYGLVGFSWERINVKTAASLEGVIGHRPETLLTFTTPLLPITREHQGGYGASIAQEDAHSNHSLSARNPAHKRDQYGRILHGYYVTFTAAIGGGAPAILVTSQVQQSNVTPKAIVHEHRSVLPESLRFDGPVIMRNVQHDMRTGMLGIVANPWSADSYRPLPYEWAEYTALQFDTPFRTLSRWHGTMFRMDSIEDINQWAAEFITAAAAWLSTTRNARYKGYLREASAAWASRAPNVVSPKSGKGRFDFGILDDSND